MGRAGDFRLDLRTPNDRSLHWVLRDVVHILRAMQVAKTLAGKAKQAGNVHVHAEMREGMLSSEFFLCIEVEIDLEAATSPWTVVRASQGARALFDFAPWGDLMGKDFLQIIHPADIPVLLDLTDPWQRNGSKQTAGMTRAAAILKQQAIVRVITFFLHQFSSDAVAGAALQTEDSKNVTFTASDYRTMRVGLSNRSRAVNRNNRLPLLINDSQS